MRICSVLFGAVILGAASQAHAELSGWCFGTAKDQSTFVTPVISLPPRSAEDDFTEWLEAKTGKSIGIAYCYGYDSRAEAETEHAASLQHMYGSGVNVTLVSGYSAPGLGGSQPASSSRPISPSVSTRPKASNATRSKSGGSGGYLTVESNTDLIDARKKWEQAVLQSQRDDAAARAKQIADAARDRADMQVKLDKLFEAMRKRGSAQ